MTRPQFNSSVQLFDLAGDHVDDVFADVRHTVADALQVVRGEEQARRRLHTRGVGGHNGDQLGERGAILRVDLVVTLADLARLLDVDIHERLNTKAYLLDDEIADVNKLLQGRNRLVLADTQRLFGDADRLVTHALQFIDDELDGDEFAHVARDRRLERHHGDATAADAALELVDLAGA